MMHHIICDWASIGNFWRDLSAFYRAGCLWQPARAASPCRSSMATTRLGNTDQLSRRELEQDLAYWEENLRGPRRS